MMKSRDYSFDVIRLVAMGLIVLMHSPVPGSAPGVVLAGLSYVTAPGIGLFFMLSGALLLGNTLTTREFITRRFSKIVWPTLFWTAFYLIVNALSTPPHFTGNSSYGIIHPVLGAGAWRAVVHVHPGGTVSAHAHPQHVAPHGRAA